MISEKSIEIILDRVVNLESDRARYDNLFTECGKYSWPAVQDMVKCEYDEASGANVRTVDIYDSTAIMASRKMAAGIFSNLYPVGVRWFEFKPSNFELARNREICKQFADATDIVLAEIWRSNFQNKMISKIRSKIVFGTGSISVKRSKNNKIVFETYHISNVLFDEDCDGIPDTVFRKLWYTARQCRQKFPKSDLGKTIETELKENKHQNKKYEILHCVFPREDYDATKKLGKESKRFVSLYINREDKHLILEDNGFDENPYIIGRLDEVPDELMAIGITANLLPDIKMTSAMCETFVEGCERQSNPTIMMEDDGVVGQPNASPGGIMYIRSGAQYPQALKTDFNPSLNAEIIRQYKQDLREGYHLNLFDVLQDHKNMTAEEVQQRARDSMQLLSPFVGSEQQEADILITRVFNILLENEVIPPFTSPEGKDIDFDIVYNSRLAMTGNLVQANATETFLAKWAPYNELHPVLDNFDIDEAAIQSALAEGVSSRIINSEDKVLATRNARAQQQQALQSVAAIESASKAYKNTIESAQQGSPAQMLIEGNV